MRSNSRILPTVLAATIALAALGACSSGSTSTSTSSASSSASSQAPEAKISTDAEVAAGLAKLRTQAAEVLAAADSSAAQAAADRLEETWKTIEGTVKQKDPSSYLTFEEVLTTLRDSSKDAAAKRAAADSLDATAAAYLAAHPG